MYKLKLIILSAICGLLTFSVTAGNTDRAGEAGAFHLLMNPWARSSGFHSLNTAHIYGVEAMRLNVGGLSKINQTQIALSRSIWWQGSDIDVNSFGLAQTVGDGSVIGISLMTVNVGDIEVTTDTNPDGTGVFFSPTLTNIGLSFSKEFSSSISGGATVRIINEAIADASANGVAFDAGILYTAGKEENIRFGISLRNVGAPMRYSGDGLSFATQAPDGDFPITVDNRAEKFELPSMLNIGLAYDISVGEGNTVTLLGNFTSNSFTKDALGAGVEFSLMEKFSVRAAYRYEDGVFGNFDVNERTNIHTGISAGFSLDLPLKEDGPKFGLDYSFRGTNPFGGTHSLGVKIDI